MSFRPLPEHELQLLSDERLIAYIRDARAAGDAAAARRGLALLVYGYERDVRRRLSLRLPAHAVEDATHDALVRAISAAFDGTSRGQFRSWLHTIVDRTAADWFRRASRRPPEAPLASEHSGEADAWMSEEPSVDGEAGAVHLRILIEELLAELPDRHRQVIEQHVFGALAASRVCEMIDGMTEANVAQIASRFRRRLRARLEPGGEAAP
ncbi:MAG TPA: RNA polymerase sigma factor [Solirubrobacteraceae bacterium]|nr:RNA polymerase sigma factor [Solirubrobacteraceae bacterium]